MTTKITLNPISTTEIDWLRQPGLNYKKSEVLCRMGIFSYYKTQSEIRKAIGNEWSHLEVWVDENIENQGFLAWTDKVAILSFRGTDSGSDWLINAQAFFPEQHDLGGRRHNGFNMIWSQCSARLFEILNEDINSDSVLWITGHSLGGALSTAAAAEFLNNKPNRIRDFYVMTFGSPRYGNEVFQKAYDQRMLEKHWFYVNQSDPVPHLGPNWMGYRHTGILKYFSKQGVYLNVDKDAVGLQASLNTAEEDALNHMHLIDKDIEKFSQSEIDLKFLVTAMMAQANQPEISIISGVTKIDDASGTLQGDSLWTAAAHNSALYWKNINSIANP